MRLERIATMLILWSLALASAAVAFMAVPSVAGSAGPAAQAAGVQILFPEGTVLQVRGFGPLTRFAVSPPDAQLVGAFHADHFLWIMAWTNGTPLPMCPIYEGYVGSPMNATYNESLKPETYTFGEVCGGWGNLTVTQTIELVYAGGGSGGSTGGIGGSGTGNAPAVSTAADSLVAGTLSAAVAVGGLGAIVAWRGPRRRGPPPPPPS